MRRAVIHRPLRIAGRHQAVNKARSKTVAAADAVEDFQVGIFAALVKLGVHPCDGRPVVDRRCLGGAQRGGRGLEIRIGLHRRPDHLFERGDVNMQKVFVRPFDLEA